MDRRVFLSTLGGSLLAAPLAAEAQQADKVYRVAILFPVTSEAGTAAFEAFRRRLRELGWVDGKNVVLDPKFGDGRYERLPDLAAELVRRSPDVIVARSSTTVHAVRQVTTAIPIVMDAVSDPVGSGFAASLARPGGNITGTSFNSRELNAKRLELLHEIIPAAKDVAMLTNPTSERMRGQQVYDDMQVVAQRLGIRLHVVTARRPDELQAAFSAMVRNKARALIVNPDPFYGSERRRIIGLAATHRLPAIYFTGDWAESGGLMTYAPNLVELTAGAAVYVDKILKGAKPADLPVEQPTKFELVINLKTAKALGLTIPPSLLLRADRVIE